MTNNIILKNINNSTTTNEDTEMNNDLSNMTLKHYKDASLIFSKEDEKTIITVYFEPEEDEDWKQTYINGFSANQIAEIILSEKEEEAVVEKAIKIFAESITKLYNEKFEPHRDFYESVEKIKNDYKGIDNLEIIVKDDDPDAMFVEYITAADVELWRINKMDEDY